MKVKLLLLVIMLVGVAIVVVSAVEGQEALPVPTAPPYWEATTITTMQIDLEPQAVPVPTPSFRNEQTSLERILFTWWSG